MKKRLFLVGVLAVALVLSSCSIFRNVRNAVNAAKSAAAETSSLSINVTELPGPTGGPSSAGSVGEKGYWPDELPSYIPAFDRGEYLKDKSYKISIAKADSFYMCFAGVARQDAVDYAAELKSAGFENIVSETTNTYGVLGSLKRDGVERVTIVMNWDSYTGDCMIVVSVIK